MSNFVVTLYHKSGPLGLYAALMVSGVLGGNFFEILSVFWVETHICFFLLRTTLHVLATNKKVVGQKMAIFRPLSTGGGVGALSRNNKKKPQVHPRPQT